MPTVLLIFEFLGTTELLVIAFVALIIFGPRKLPQIGRTVGKSIAEFKRASDDFKRTWEYEVELDQRKPRARRAAGGGRGAGVRRRRRLRRARVGRRRRSSAARAPQPDIGGETIARNFEPRADEPAAAGKAGRAAAAEEDEINAS